MRAEPVLSDGEPLLWSGVPTGKRPMPRNAVQMAATGLVVAAALWGIAWYVATFKTYVTGYWVAVYSVQAMSVGMVLLAINASLGDLWRARAQDRCTTYGVTPLRAIAATPRGQVYMLLTPDVQVHLSGDTVTLWRETPRGAPPVAPLRFERLVDADHVLRLIRKQQGAGTKQP